MLQMQAMQLLILILRSLTDQLAEQLQTQTETNSALQQAGSSKGKASAAVSTESVTRARAAVRELWAAPTAQVLAAANASAARLVADLFLPEVLKLDPGCLPCLCHHLRAVATAKVRAQVQHHTDAHTSAH